MSNNKKSNDAEDILSEFDSRTKPEPTPEPEPKKPFTHQPHRPLPP